MMMNIILLGHNEADRHGGMADDDEGNSVKKMPKQRSVEQHFVVTFE